MGLLGLFKSSKDHSQDIANLGFEVSDCSQECDACTSRFPSSVAIETKDPLWNSTKPYGLHVVVPTNKCDWIHDATDVPGQMPYAVQQWASSAKFTELGETSTIKVTVSSLSSLKLENDPDYMLGKHGDVLLLPFFVWVKGVTVDNVDKVLDKVVPDLCRFRDEKLEQLPTTSFPAYPDVSVEVDAHLSYVFMCSHKTRDKRCGITAPIMKKEMDIHLRDLGLYRDVGDDRPGGVRVAYINHIGGHKYAANVIIYLKRSGKNIWLARCKPNNVVPIIDECIVGDGKVWPDKVRQVQKYKPVEW